MKEMVSQGKVYPLGLTFGDLEHPVERQVTVSSVRSRWKEALIEEKLRLSTQLKLHLTRSMKEGNAKHDMVGKEGEVIKTGGLRESKQNKTAGGILKGPKDRRRRSQGRCANEHVIWSKFRGKSVSSSKERAAELASERQRAAATE